VTLGNQQGGAGAVVAPVIADGKVVAFVVENGGAGYTAAPALTVTGGRASSGSDAKATLYIANGQVTAALATDGGAGYHDPLRVVIAPGAAQSNVIPVWAAAGGLVSDLDDMARLAEAALGDPIVNGVDVPALITEGFHIAESAHACQAEDSDLATCPAGVNRVGLAWEIFPVDQAHDTPEIVTKNGGLHGFSSQVVVVPAANLGVVALVSAEKGAPAQTLALQIAYDLIYSSR
jgi:CubicO group peptidase (beta-lactamase class C family)